MILILYLKIFRSKNKFILIILIFRNDFLNLNFNIDRRNCKKIIILFLTNLSIKIRKKIIIFLFSLLSQKYIFNILKITLLIKRFSLIFKAI